MRTWGHRLLEPRQRWEGSPEEAEQQLQLSLRTSPRTEGQGSSPRREGRGGSLTGSPGGHLKGPLEFQGHPKWDRPAAVTGLRGIQGPSGSLSIDTQTAPNDSLVS